MEAFPILITERLRLRRMKLSDFPSLMKYANNRKISDQIFNIPYPYTEEYAIFRMNFMLQAFANKERFIFAITFKEQNELIGEIGLHLDKPNNKAEIGYWVAEPFWGKGIATEAVKAILNFGFAELDLNKIFATHYPENPASGKVLANCGMIKEAELKEHYLIDNVYKSVNQYRLTKAEFTEINR